MMVASTFRIPIAIVDTYNKGSEDQSVIECFEVETR